MGAKLFPGKGGLFHLNGDTMRFFCQALDDISSKIEDVCMRLLNNSDEADDEYDTLNMAIDVHGADEVFEQLHQQLITFDNGDLTWHHTEDNFGKKLYTSLDWQSGEYRVTVVLLENSRTGDTSLNIDLRSWYDPKGQR